MKRCLCGLAYDAAGRAGLTLRGVQVIPGDEEEPEERFELRDCRCGSTLFFPIEPKLAPLQK